MPMTNSTLLMLIQTKQHCYQSVIMKCQVLLFNTKVEENNHSEKYQQGAS